MLRKYPELRKNSNEECFDLVRQGSTVYIQVFNQHYNLDKHKSIKVASILIYRSSCTRTVSSWMTLIALGAAILLLQTTGLKLCPLHFQW